MRKITSAIAVLLLLVYIGYQVILNLTDSIVTMEALSVTVEDKVTCDGIFVRTMDAVYGQEDKTYEFMVENGEKVSQNEEIAAFFDDSSAAEAFRQAETLRQEIAYAEAAYADITADKEGASLDSAIFDSMEELSGMLSLGQVWETDSLYSGLTQTVIAREYPRDDIAGFKSNIDAMKASLKQYETAYSSKSYSVKADAPGYFAKATESSPTLCTSEEMYSLTPDSLENLMNNGAVEQASGVIGYIISDFEWYFVCCISADDAQQLNENGLGLYFPYLSSKKVSASVKKVTYFDDEAIVIFSCGVINETFLRGVESTVDIVKNTYTGIKVPRQALHQQDGKWGVFCLNGAVNKFKAVEWVYEGEDYYIVKPAESASKGLYYYYKMVIKGKGLEDNKVID